MRLPRMRTLLQSTLLLLAATTLPAQKRVGPPGGRPTMDDCPMMGAMERSPAAALHNRDRLHLTADQVSRLDALVRGMDSLHMRAMDSMKTVHQQLAAMATLTAFDEPRVRSALDRMGRLHTDMGVAMLRAQYSAGSILTAPQRDTLNALARRHHAMPGMAQARPGECPMMMMMMDAPHHKPMGPPRRP